MPSEKTTVVDESGPAFPCEGGDMSGLYAHPGMTLRDWFAGQALYAFMRLSYSSGGGYMQYTKHAQEAAKCCYTMADAMLEQRLTPTAESR